MKTTARALKASRPLFFRFVVFLAAVTAASSVANALDPFEWDKSYFNQQLAIAGQVLTQIKTDLDEEIGNSVSNRMISTCDIWLNSPTLLNPVCVDFSGRPVVQVSSRFGLKVAMQDLAATGGTIYLAPGTYAEGSPC